MSFSGKKFKRVSAENIDKLAENRNLSDRVKHQLMSSDALFSFTKIDDVTYAFEMQAGDKIIANSTFKLGEETEMTRRDGSKVQVTYYAEGDNVLRQTIRPSDSKCAYFRREFTDNQCVLTIKVDDSDVEAKITYEQVA